MMKIEIAYTFNNQVYIIKKQLPPETTVLQALEKIIFPAQAGIDLTVNKVGIYGQFVEFDRVLNNGDRIEIYQPLVADPKEIRLRRSKKKI